MRTSEYAYSELGHGLSQMAERNNPVCVSELFWNNSAAISSRLRPKGLLHAVEGYASYIKICNEGGTTSVEANAHWSMENKMQNPLSKVLF